MIEVCIQHALFIEITIRLCIAAEFFKHFCVIDLAHLFLDSFEGHVHFGRGQRRIFLHFAIKIQ